MLVFYSFSTVEKNINIYFLSLSIWSKKTTFPTFDPRTAYASFFWFPTKRILIRIIVKLVTIFETEI